MTATSTRPGMFTSQILLQAVQRRLGKRLDGNQLRAVEADSDQSLFLVAGPGSGKTTVLTLRVLKLVFVDGVEPGAILATTFTRRAAAELRSRILGWGDQLRSELGGGASSAQQAWLKRLDLNRILTGTLDSLAEQVLRDFRGAGMQPPLVLDEFIGRALMFREGVLGTGAYGNDRLKAYLKTLCGGDDDVRTNRLGTLASEIRQRFIHDRVDRTRFLASQPPEAKDLLQVIEAYEAQLASSQVLDFALLEQQFYERLRSGALARFTDALHTVLVDEYQDTNLLQESIYFEMARAAARGGGGITVVGDDDQSLYRFRGATVDLFRDFTARLGREAGISPQTIYLNTNYRSTKQIVGHTMAYVDHDPAYMPARVVGKPPLRAGRGSTIADFPILAMFRPDLDQLAKDLADFVRDVAGPGRRVNTPTGTLTIRVDQRSGSVGDIALLCSSPKEYSSGGKMRLPKLLRQELGPRGFEVFNPRGQEFSEIRSVQIVCGLMLECIDPDSVVQASLVPKRLPGDVSATLDGWRGAAREFVLSNPPAPKAARGGPRHTLGDFVRAWQRRTPQTGGKWPDEASLITLLYNLITWIPDMQEDAEGLVYLEAITRTITQSAHFSSFKAEIRGDAAFADRSVAAAIRDIFAPLAAGEIEIDEDLLETAPRDRLNVLSIHQSKGLEFPLVIVDVGSDFKMNHSKQRFRRFPDKHGRPHALEDALRPHSPLGRPARSPLDRTFDDLLRLYFVALSRPQDVLLLVGLCDPKTGRPKKSIPNIALGWERTDATPGGARWPLLPSIVHL